MHKVLLLISVFMISVFALDVTQFAQTIKRNDRVLEKMLQLQNPKAYNTYQSVLQLKKDRIVQRNQSYNAVIYLTSSSVTPEHFIKIALEAGKTKDVNITVFPMIQGLDKSLQKQVTGYRNAMQTYTPHRRSTILTSSEKITLSPHLFDMFKVTKVPVMITARCKGETPSPKQCQFFYVARGETTLTAMVMKAQEEQDHKIPSLKILFEEPVP